ncbi:MAG TPA: type II toxin-antitoxin system VapC family toxin [Synergistales bacterium]|nr:type II toxin-antitoxin system VapC family toxin [Synergistales bacterium]HRV71388.1 type II toxin-antitoxin system VapC family toxin [Thermovirgaceae bacterium]
MDIVIDASAILAVIMNEPERESIIEMTTGHTLLGPGSIPWEIGNAFSSMLKQRRLSLEDACRGLEIFQTIPIRYLPVDMANAVSIAHGARLYAYDAYFLDCAARHAVPLLTLDRSLQRAASQIGIQVMGV